MIRYDFRGNATSMGYCGACGQARYDGDRYCTSCGQALRIEDSAPALVVPALEVAGARTGRSFTPVAEPRRDLVWDRFYSERNASFPSDGVVARPVGGVLLEEAIAVPAPFRRSDDWSAEGPSDREAVASATAAVLADPRWRRTKRALIKVQLVLFRRCYSASMRQGVLIDTLDDLDSVTFPVPVKSWAVGMASRRTQATGRLWRITKWVDH